MAEEQSPRRQPSVTQLILSKIDGLADDLRGLNDRVGESLSRQAVIDQRVSGLHEDVARLNAIVRDGGGSTPSLTYLVSQLQAQRHSDKGDIHANAAGIAAMAIRVDDIEKLGSRPFREMQARAVQDDRDARNARWGMWVGITTGILGIVAAIITAAASVWPSAHAQAAASTQVNVEAPHQPEP